MSDLAVEDMNSFLRLLLKRYSPACTRLLSQYKTMLKLVGDDVESIDQFMQRYRVSVGLSISRGFLCLLRRWIIRQLFIEYK